MTHNSLSDFTPDEILQALELCKHSRRDRAKPNKFWHSAGWQDVMDAIGEPKAGAIWNHLLELEAAFGEIEAKFLARLIKGDTPPFLFDHRAAVIAEFTAQCSQAPTMVVAALDADFAFRHR